MSVGEATDASTPLLVDAFLGPIAAAASLVVSSARNLNTIFAVAPVRRSVRLAVQPHPRPSTVSPSVTSTLRSLVLFGFHLLLLLSAVMCGCRGAAVVVDPNGAPAAAFVASPAGGGQMAAVANGTFADDYYDDHYDVSSRELVRDERLDPADAAARARRALRRWESHYTEKSNDSCLMSQKGEYLMIHSDGEVKSMDDLAKAWQFCRLEVSTSSHDLRRFKGLRSDRYLCMNKNGRLFGSRSVDRPGCEFVETVEGYFSTFYSPDRNRLLALNSPGPIKGSHESQNNSRASFLLLATPHRDDPIMLPENRIALERERRRGLYLQRCRRLIKRKQKSGDPWDPVKNLPAFCSSRLMKNILEQLLSETRQKPLEPTIQPGAIGAGVTTVAPAVKKGKQIGNSSEATGSGTKTGDTKRHRRLQKGRRKKKMELAKNDVTGAAVSSAKDKLSDLERERRRRRRRKRRKEKKDKEKRRKELNGAASNTTDDLLSKQQLLKDATDGGIRRHRHGDGRRKNKKKQTIDKPTPTEQQT